MQDDHKHALLDMASSETSSPLSFACLLEGHFSLVTHTEHADHDGQKLPVPHPHTDHESDLLGSPPCQRTSVAARPKFRLHEGQDPVGTI